MVKGRYTYTMPFPCHSPAATLSLSCHYPTVPNKGVGRPLAVSGRPMLIHTYHAVPMPFPCREPAVALRGRFQNGMACVSQTRPHCVNQMGKKQSKPLAELHGRGTSWERHSMCESALRLINPENVWVMSSVRLLWIIEHCSVFHIEAVRRTSAAVQSAGQDILYFLCSKHQNCSRLWCEIRMHVKQGCKLLSELKRL
jgi:hypothetical protein